MIKDFCRTAHLDDFEDERDRKKSCKKKIREIKKYQYETGVKTVGEKKLEEEYKDVWIDMKEGENAKKYHASDQVIESIRMCLRTGESFYVSS